MIKKPLAKDDYDAIHAYLVDYNTLGRFLYAVLDGQGGRVFVEGPSLSVNEQFAYAFISEIARQDAIPAEARGQDFNELPFWPEPPVVVS